MKTNLSIKKILSLKINPMCEVVHSILILKYMEGNNYSFLEDHESIENLCNTYQIFQSSNDSFVYEHLEGRSFVISIKNGRTIFEGYC